MRQSLGDDKAQVTLALAADYLEVLATARSVGLLPARRCLVALVREFAAARAGEPHDQEPGNVYVVVLEPRTAQPPRRLWGQLVGHGCGGVLVVHDLNRDGRDEIFFWVDGQACAAGVLQMTRANQARWLYRSEGRFRAEARDVNRDRRWEIVESWLTVQLDEPHYSQISRQRCLFARKLWRWDKRAGAYRTMSTRGLQCIQALPPYDPEYPETDGQPMANSTTQADVMVTLKGELGGDVPQSGGCVRRDGFALVSCQGQTQDTPCA